MVVIDFSGDVKIFFIFLIGDGGRMRCFVFCNMLIGMFMLGFVKILVLWDIVILLFLRINFLM